MTQRLTMSNRLLPHHLTLIAGSPYPLKISGLGTDKRHVLLRCSCSVVDVVVLASNPRNFEQTLRLEPARVTTVTQATLMLTIEPRIELPPEATERGILTRLLLAENITPAFPNFVASESLPAMQWMRHVLLNRLKFGPKYFGAGRNASTLAELITSPNQVEGFEGYPNIKKVQADRINNVVRFANSSTHKDQQRYRQYLRDAINVASGAKPGSDPCPTGLYAWRTARRDPPGKNFVKYKTYGGQDFYTLTESFRSDPLQRSNPK